MLGLFSLHGSKEANMMVDGVKIFGLHAVQRLFHKMFALL